MSLAGKVNFCGRTGKLQLFPWRKREKFHFRYSARFGIPDCCVAGRITIVKQKYTQWRFSWHIRYNLTTMFEGNDVLAKEDVDSTSLVSLIFLPSIQ